MKKNYYELANKIITLVGGENNVATLYNCVTRLRFSLYDYNLAVKNQDKLQDIHGIISVVIANEQFQIVIGRDVTLAYNAILLEYPSLKEKT